MQRQPPFARPQPLPADPVSDAFGLGSVEADMTKPILLILAIALLVGLHAYIAAHPTSAAQSIEWGVR